MLSKPNFLIFDGGGCNYFHVKFIKISSIEEPLKDEVMKILRASFTYSSFAGAMSHST